MERGNSFGLILDDISIVINVFYRVFMHFVLLCMFTSVEVFNISTPDLK